MTGQPDGPGAMLAFAFYLALIIFVVALLAIGLQKAVDRFREDANPADDMPLAEQRSTVPTQRQERHR